MIYCLACPECEPNSKEEEEVEEEEEIMQMNEWKMLSQIGISHNIRLDELDMLGKRDFDNNNKWDQIIIPKHLREIATKIINTNKKIT